LGPVREVEHHLAPGLHGRQADGKSSLRHASILRAGRRDVQSHPVVRALERRSHPTGSGRLDSTARAQVRARRGAGEGTDVAKGKNKKHHSEGSSTISAGSGGDAPAKLKRKEYEKHMQRLHGELVAMQEWVKSSGARICIVFEGRDTAGK